MLALIGAKVPNFHPAAGEIPTLSDRGHEPRAQHFAG
jgi:hypothetical protein